VVTTNIAFIALVIRAFVVYFELGVALIQSGLYMLTSPATQTKPSGIESSGQSSPKRQRHRRSSGQSSISLQDHTNPRRQPKKSGSFASLIGNAGPTRDFEGVGGWRVPGEEDEEALWIGMNSRLELPANLPTHQRKHQRSLTADSQRNSWSPGAIRMSPVQSRSRTPIPSGGDSLEPEGYFGVLYHKRSSISSDPVIRSTYEPRRKSVGGSSTSSTNSRRTSIKGIGV
jgi:hypothetical protein